MKKIETIQDLLDETSKDLRNINNLLNRSQQTDEYKFGLACYKVFSKTLEPISKTDIENNWTDGRGDGGIDFVYISNDEDNDRIILNICQAKYGENISIETIKNAANKMIDTIKDCKNKKNINLSDKAHKILLDHLDENYDSISYKIFLKFTKDKVDKKSINKIIRDAKEQYKEDLMILFEDDILEEVSKYQEQPKWVDYDKLVLSGGGCLRMTDKTGRNEKGIIVNAKASSLYNFFKKYSQNGLFEQNLRFFTQKNSVDNPIIDSIRQGGRDFWFHNNGIIIACESFVYDNENVKLNKFSIINGCQTVSLIGKHWSSEQGDFSLLCKIISPMEDEDYSNFVTEVAKSANNQKPISPRDLKSNDAQQNKIKKDFSTLGVFYENKRGERSPKGFLKVNNSDFGLMILSFYLQRPSIARSGRSKIFSSDNLYKSIFNHEFNYQVLKQIIELQNSIIEIIDKKINDIDGDENKYAKNFLNNGKFFVLSAIGYIVYKLQSKESIWNIVNLFKNPLPDDFKEMLQDIIIDIAWAVADAYNIAFEKNKVISMVNFLKAENNYKDIINQLNKDFFSTTTKTQSTKELFGKVFDI